MDFFMAHIIQESRLEVPGTVPDGVELARRQTERADYHFALNQLWQCRNPLRSLLAGPAETAPFSYACFKVIRI
ncbi:MAG: hypothetical protein PWQ29_664 [Verrucomicrobiota bacterium]|jgi:hypothetical protein|nr:hypothetical protein [Verrucomicrobiota bacterium]MDK2963270.1 hypothetical protein [Verrucomicrobiota bacterium]